MKTKEIEIMGSPWTIEEVDKSDEKLCDHDGKQIYDGYTDEDDRVIYLLDTMSDKYYRRVLRHELIHAFLFESGLSDEMRYTDHGHDETIIDWFAIQYPKIVKVYVELAIDY